MKFSATVMGAALVASGVSAQKAIVNNNCKTSIYVQSFPFDGSAAGPLTTVAAGKSFSEDFRKSGSTVKIATTKTLTSPLFFGYSFSANPDYAYYEFSSEWGNPFASSHNILTPGDGCMVFDCAANQKDCYSTPASKKVFGCPQPVDLTATLCA
ncbi:putative 16 kDa allergen [Rosellinia necatrix]|uniref:Putative 16 kDa allergen n=1 Tax=Rosellinia necatrix TaxID=77044 RepID=A0A1S7UIJ2_ROSNE|nr:putative 16 kDa allergen [Rosellinia necatrix]